MQRLVGTKSKNIFKMVRMKGVEPIRLAAPDPKSGASASSATSAQRSYFIISAEFLSNRNPALPHGTIPM